MIAADASVRVPASGHLRRFRGLWVVAVWEERAHPGCRHNAALNCTRLFNGARQRTVAVELETDQTRWLLLDIARDSCSSAFCRRRDSS